MEWMLKHHDEFNDYLYVLIHLYLKDPRYREFCLEYRKKPNSFILFDNSAAELGEAMDNKLLFEAACELQPDYVMMPDKLNDYKVTTGRSQDFFLTYASDLPRETKLMGIIQGQNFKEMVHCHYSMTDYTGAAAIGIPFIFANIARDSYSQMMARIEFMRYMNSCEHPCVKPRENGLYYHLLGTWCTAEFALYKTLGYNWINSFDTSNPIMAALEGKTYVGNGIPEKPKTKLDDVFHHNYGKLEPHLDLARYNVRRLRQSI